MPHARMVAASGRTVQVGVEERSMQDVLLLLPIMIMIFTTTMFGTDFSLSSPVNGPFGQGMND